MARSSMLALVDPSIDTTGMFKVHWYVEQRLEMMGYDVEEDLIQDAMVYNTRARIEMARARTLKSVPRPRPSCVVQFQAYVLPQLKSRTSSRRQRRGQHAKSQPVLTVVARAAQVKQDRAADAAQRPPQPTIPNAHHKEPAVPMQPQEADQRIGKPSSPDAPKRTEQIKEVKADTNRFGTNSEDKNSEGWEKDTRSRVRTTETIEEMVQRFSKELDAELQEVDMLSADLDAELQKIERIEDPALKQLQQQNSYFSETYVEIRQRKANTTISRPVEPSKSRVPVEPSRSRVPGRWPRQAVASRSRVMGRRSWKTGHVPTQHNTPKVQRNRKPPPEIDKTIHNPEKVRGIRYQTTPRKGVLDIGYWRYPCPGHGEGLAPFRHGRCAIRERPIGKDLIPCDQRQ